MQPEFQSNDLVFRMLDGASQGALLPVTTQKCLLGDNVGKGQVQSHLVILRSPNGAAIQSHGADVFVNGSPVNSEWLKQGDEIQFGHTRIEVVQVGAFEDAQQSNIGRSTAHEPVRESVEPSTPSSASEVEELEPLDSRVDSLTDELSNLTSSLETEAECQPESQTEMDGSRIFSPLDHLDAAEQTKTPEPTTEACVSPQLASELSQAGTLPQPTNETASSCGSESPCQADGACAATEARNQPSAREIELEAVFDSINRTREQSDNEMAAAPSPATTPVPQPVAGSNAEDFGSSMTSLSEISEKLQSQIGEAEQKLNQLEGDDPTPIDNSGGYDQPFGVQEPAIVDARRPESFENTSLANAQAEFSAFDSVPNSQTETMPGSDLPGAVEPALETPSPETAAVETMAAFETSAELPLETANVESSASRTETEPASTAPAAEQKLRELFSQHREEQKEMETRQEETPQPQVAPQESDGNESVADLLARMQAAGQLDSYQPPTEDGDDPGVDYETPSPMTQAHPEPVRPEPQVSDLEEADEDTSVQDYMNRLLGRTGDEASNKEATNAPSAKAEETKKNVRNHEPVKLLDPNEYKPANSVPEKEKNLDAFRELANQSNRMAINKSNSERAKAVAMTNFSIMGLGILLSVYLFATADGFGTNLVLGGLTAILSLGLGAFAAKTLKANS